MKLENPIRNNETRLPVIPIARTPPKRINGTIKVSRDIEWDNYAEIEWNPERIKLIEIDPGNRFKGYTQDKRDLLDVLKRTKEAGGLPLPAKVLEFLLKNQKYVPTDWRNKRIAFAGDIYEGNFNNYSNINKTYTRAHVRSLQRNLKFLAKDEIKSGKLPLKILYHLEYPLWCVLFGFKEYVEGSFQFDDFGWNRQANDSVPIYLK